ncbi:MAG: pilus assembly protein PilM [Candidatus Dependentiae bacterium]|nr:pilus assembly protein PilM [Candidatus Dependentiae bacterium]
MFRDILVPYRVGKYYLFSKRVLSFNITPVMVQGLLIDYKGRGIEIKNNITINLKDFSTQSQINAIKKIASSIGKYDEVVTSLSSSAVAFKELSLPFLGRDKLDMIVAYEVESLLPFSVDEAVVDFMVTSQDLDKKISTVLVAAARKEDIDAHYLLFEKAEISLSVITIDLFALYELYFWGIYSSSSLAVASQGITSQLVSKPISLNLLLPSPKSFKFQNLLNFFKGLFNRKPDANKEFENVVQTELKHKRVELLVDIGFDVIRILYMQDGLLKAMRIIPFGISDVAQSISKETGQSYYDVANDLISLKETEISESILTKELKNILDEASKTLSFFEKQENLTFVSPQKIWLSGLGCNLLVFSRQATDVFGSSVSFVDVEKIVKQLSIKESSKEKLSVSSFALLSLGLFTHYQQNINFLKSFARKADISLLNKQLITIFCMTILCLGGAIWKSSTVLTEWEANYNVSKKQLVTTISNRMNIDLKSEKNLKTIVEKTQDAFNKEKVLWFSFSRKNERSILQYLQDLSIHVDRSSIGLEILSMHIDYDKVSMIGTVKSIEAVGVFEEELMELTSLTLVEKPREVSFSVQLKVKEGSEGSI